MNPSPRGRDSRPTPRWKKGVVGRAVQFATHDAWHAELGGVPTFHRLWMRTYRIVHIAVRGFFQDKCSREAAVLTYITIFSLPALLIFAFSIARGFGAYDTLQQRVINPFLDRTFSVPVEEDADTLRGEEETSGLVNGEPPEEDAGTADSPSASTASEDPPLPDADEGEVDPPPDAKEESESKQSGEQVRQVVDQIFAAVKDVDYKALTGVGFLLLIYSAIKMLAAVERSLNGIWGIRRARTLVRRLTDYLSIVVVAPILLILGSALTVYLKSEWFANAEGRVGLVFRPVVALLPVFSVWLGLTFVLLTMPNKRVRLSSAMLGGVVAGLGWQLVQYAHVEFQIGIARMQPIYSSFVAIPLFLIWIYLSWNAFLAGAEVACAHENEGLYTSIARTGTVDQAYREALAPRLAGRITAAFLAGDPAPDALQLATELKVAPRTATDVLEALAAHDLLVQVHEDRGEGFVPGRDPDSISVLDLLQALRSEDGTTKPPVRNRLDARVDDILASFDETLRASLPNYTLRELARSCGEDDPAEEIASSDEPAT